MPDVFVAPDEKPIRNRIPIVSREPSSVLFTKDTNQNIKNPQIKESLTNTQKPTSDITFSSPQPPINSSPTNEDKPSEPIPSYDDIERRNGLMPLVTSFWQNPKSIYFDTQEPDEHILLFLRRHFITNVPWIAITIVLLILPPIVDYLLHKINYPIVLLPGSIMRIVVILYYLLILTNAFLNFLEWYYNISIITTKRILDIQLKDLVNKKVSATKIALIQDVDFKQTGTIPSIFNYGDVIMQTAGKEINFVADSVPNPELVVQVVESLIGKPEEVEIEGEQNATI